MTLKDGLWEGASVAVVGGGPSLAGFDFTKLKNCTLAGAPAKVIAINGAIKACPFADLWFTEDLRVVELYYKTSAWRAFDGLKVLHALSPSFAAKALDMDPSLTIISRKRQDKFWSRTLADGLSLSSNSGVGAINLAQILGAVWIYLLGFDCKVSNTGGANFHDDYRKAHWDETGNAQFASFKSDFEHWVEPHARSMKVINLTPIDDPSAIECWPRWDLKSFFSNGRPAEIIIPFAKQVPVRHTSSGSSWEELWGEEVGAVT